MKKKKKKFNINTINNMFWPMTVVGFLIIAAILSNTSVIQTTGNVTQSVPALQPGLAQNIQQQNFQAPSLRSTETALILQEAISHVLAQVRTCVVGISRTSSPQVKAQSGLGYIQSYNVNSKSYGSGILIDPRGFVITGFQTIGKDRIVQVNIFSARNKKYQADLVAVDPDTDIAILKIRSSEQFPYIVCGNSDLVEVGDIVFAIGNPFGFSGTATMGIVSSNNRNVDIDGVNYPDLIQTDASINEGNDGGALVNIKGEVIGVNMASYMPHANYSGIGFAVPMNDIVGFLRANIF